MIGGAGMTSPHAIQLSGGLSVDESTSYSFRWRYPGKRIGWVGALSVWPPARQLPQRGNQVGGAVFCLQWFPKRAVRSSGKPTCLSLWERWHGGAVTERVSPRNLSCIDRPPCREGALPPSVLRECPASGRRGPKAPSKREAFLFRAWGPVPRPGHSSESAMLPAAAPFKIQTPETAPAPGVELFRFQNVL